MTPRQVLHSWKEIAKYTGRGIRTLQRYESQFGFPVHRPTGGSRSAVLAFSDEVDAWFGKTPQRLSPRIMLDPEYLEAKRRLIALRARAKASREQTQALRQMSVEQRARLRAIMQKLRDKMSSQKKK